MTITSVGYQGKVNSTVWGDLVPFLGKGPVVAGENDWKGTILSSADRTLRISAGVGYGWGIRDYNDANVDIQLPTISSGTRWDTIVAKRDWATKTTTLTYRTGGASMTVAGGLLDDAGNTQAEQPLYLARVQAGQQFVTALIDLREINNLGDMRRFGSADARNYWFTDPYPGAQAYIVNGGVSAYAGDDTWAAEWWRPYTAPLKRGSDASATTMVGTTYTDNSGSYIMYANGWCQVRASVRTNFVQTFPVGIQLPVPAVNRDVENVGSMCIIGTGAPADQIGVAILHADLNHVVGVRYTSGFLPAGNNNLVSCTVGYRWK